MHQQTVLVLRNVSGSVLRGAHGDESTEWQMAYNGDPTELDFSALSLRVRVRVRKRYLKSDNVNNITLALI